MEADWEIEIGGEAPVIDACWPGLVDLRTSPERVRELPELGRLPGLGDALIRLNANSSPVWTAKCDVWSVAEFDAFELDATTHGILNALACYVDLLPESDELWSYPDKAIAFCKEFCARLRSIALRDCRADLIIRRAVIAPGTDGLGITAYLTACGASDASAIAQLESALATFADSVLAEPTPPTARSKYNETTGE